MKTGKKSGRWKYAVPVLILVLILALLGLLWNNVNNTSNSTDEIYLYGEWHSDSHILDRELEIWGEYYKKGMRDLFVEYPYTDAQFLNLWMQADDDELLDQQFKDWEGTAGGTEIVNNFLKQIKKNYPRSWVKRRRRSTGRPCWKRRWTISCCRHCWKARARSWPSRMDGALARRSSPER